MIKKAVVLLSGGLDSAVTLYYAKSKGYNCRCLIFDYGQRHIKEMRSAKKIAEASGCRFEIIKVQLPWGGSSLLDDNLAVPKRNNVKSQNRNQAIPSTYVPARNIIFLSFALSYAETIKAEAIFIGAHAQDYSGYPDCRPEFYRAFVGAAKRGTRTGVKGSPVKIITPLLNYKKAQIIKLGHALGVPFKFTWSCYQGGKTPCGNCDSCFYRQKGFKEAGLFDPALKNVKR